MVGWYEGIQPLGLEASAHPTPLTHSREMQAVWHRESSPGWGQGPNSSDRLRYQLPG